MRERGETAMIKLLGPNNDLRTEDGVITKWGYLVAIASTVFGLCCFLVGRKIYGELLAFDDR